MHECSRDWIIMREMQLLKLYEGILFRRNLMIDWVTEWEKWPIEGKVEGIEEEEEEGGTEGRGSASLGG